MPYEFSKHERRTMLAIVRILSHTSLEIVDTIDGLTSLDEKYIDANDEPKTPRLNFRKLQNSINKLFEELLK